LKDSRISGLYKLSVVDRIGALEEQGWLSAADARRLRDGRQVLSGVAADRIIENVVGVFGLPFAIAPNFRVNDRDSLVPLVVEEPSIVAALSGAALLARGTGGYRARCEESLLAGQVHVTGLDDIDRAVAALESGRQALIDEANAVHPRLLARGGGVRDLEIRRLVLPDGSPLIAVHLLVDTADAMGANLVNTICEAVAPTIARACRGKVALRILSNLTDRAVVRASVRFPTADLGSSSLDGPAVRDGIVLASEIAQADSHRAATHNKGVMNGIDPLAIATGNDWRAIEAGAHAFAAASGRYLPLTRWAVDDAGDLVGDIALPLKVGTVGGTLKANPAAALGLAISGVRSALELAELMAAVGLAQNFAALRALATSGIQKGHMKLHARSVAAAAGTPDEYFDAVVERLVASGEIKGWKAEEILEELGEPGNDAPQGIAAGKVILLGEHAVVYGRHALALPIPGAVSARAEPTRKKTFLAIPDWGIARDIDGSGGIDAAVSLIRKEIGVESTDFSIRVDTTLPGGMGLGSSAAIAVAITRALAAAARIDLPDERVNAIAFACEKLAHGTPSGVDNTISTYARPMLFCNRRQLQVETLDLAAVPPMVIANGQESGLTSEQVAGVRARHEKSPERYEALFDEIDRISLAGAEMLRAGHYDELGALMNICHGLLNALEVSTPELERMVVLARQLGASGAKLTGAGGGGSIVALCPDAVDEVEGGLREAGYRTLVLQS